MAVAALRGQAEMAGTVEHPRLQQLLGDFASAVSDDLNTAKALTGRDGEVRRCLGCNQECVGRVGLNRPLGCMTNPRAGRELDWVTHPASIPKRIAVVGAGAAVALRRMKTSQAP